jgi:arsenate reductase
MEIWFNPACSKCRMTREALDAAGAEYTLRQYLDEPPTADELRDVLAALRLEPWDITRTGDELARRLDVASLPRDRDTWIALLVDNPSLIQRPIAVTDDGTAWIARDPETVQTVVERAVPGDA